ncbi:hypothetical protein B0H10DRAFT_1937656 [Mycena sp. CBHHK59/15]|nr:hypothetical protein B0H10DRAFT_1937656 [Mycena sp. CBHHK59/15]
MAVNLTPKADPQYPKRLQSLVVSLEEWFIRLGGLTDLEAALKHAQTAVELTPKTHSELDLNDLNAALENIQASIHLTPKDHSQLPGCLQAVAMFFRHRYNHQRDLKDIEASLTNLEAAISLDLHTALVNDQKAVQLTTKDHPDYARRLQGLAVTYIEQYRKLGDLQDLESGLQNSKAAVRSTPEGHPELPRCLQILAVCLQDRYHRLQDPDDHAAAFTNYTLSFKNPIVSKPVSSWEAALEWASLTKGYKASEVLNAYSTAFNLLPEILWIGNPVNVHQDAKRRINFTQATSDAIAACIGHASLPLAVEILEQELATTFQRLLQLKPNINTLVQEEADKQQISTQLYLGNSLNPKGLAIDRNVTLEGLEHQWAILKDVLQQCNVRMKQSDSPWLYGTQESLVSKPPQDAFGNMLTWLWDNIVEHIYKALELHGVVDGRLWWCPTGLFTGLPLHAAVRSDQFVQSYTATLDALLNANAGTLPVPALTIGMVGVTHSGSGGESGLPCVKEEIAKIVSIVGKDHVHSVVGHQATVKAVKHELQQLPQEARST